MYVQPPRRMTIRTVDLEQPTYIVTEGNMYFFFVDDCLLNSGGTKVNIEKV